MLDMNPIDQGLAIAIDTVSVVVRAQNRDDVKVLRYSPQSKYLHYSIQQVCVVL